jgi:transposase
MHDSITGFAGVDWATDTHAICVVDDHGQVRVEFDVANTADGLAELCRRVERAGARRVAIERPDGPVVDALLESGLDVVVVASRSVKALRERYGTSGNKSDRSDAFVLADCLRTDGHRWRSLEPDSPPTVTLRCHVRARKDLVENRVAVANQLRAHLRIVFPGAVGLFKDIDSPISLRFLERFPSATRAGWLSEKRLGSWLRANGYCGRKTPTELHQRLLDAPVGLLGHEGDARGTVTLAYVTILRALRAEIDELNTRLDELLDAHPDAVIFQSLPRTGTIRAATLLAEIGDCRARFPDAERILARSWAHIIWRCWQDGVAYDPARHGGYQRLSPQAA